MCNPILIVAIWTGTQPITVSSLPQISIARDWIDWVALICSSILTVAAVIGVFAALKTLRAVERQAGEMVHQAHLMNEQTAVAKQAADAALLNAKALINAERPWLLIKGTASRYPGSIDSTSGGIGVSFKATNVGRSPAEIIYSAVESKNRFTGQEILDSDPFISEGIPEEQQWIHSEWVAPESTYSIQGLNFAAQDMPDVWKFLSEGTRVLYVMGFVRYRDAIASEIHESRFCYRISIRGEMVMTGPAGYNRLT